MKVKAKEQGDDPLKNNIGKSHSTAQQECPRRTALYGLACGRQDNVRQKKTMIPTITLKRGKAESLRRFHPWIFSGAIDKKPQDLYEGQTVRVVSVSGEFLAVGHWQTGSIAVRVLSFQPCEIDGAFWRSRIGKAWNLRHSLGLVSRENDIFRLVHGEGDQLPGLVVDVYADTAVMQAHSAGMHLSRKAVADALLSETDGLIRNVYYKSDSTLPLQVGDDEREGFIIGGTENNTARENGMQFRIDWLGGQKTGFFIDQRDNRALLERYSGGKRVLNMFCYTGGFSVYALRGGAREVVSVDASQTAIRLTGENVALNFPSCGSHEAHAEDAFRFLDKLPFPGSPQFAGNSFELIVLDPPAFAKHRSAVRNALKGYTRLNLAAMKKIAPGGLLFTFSCSQAVSAEQFRLAVFTAAAQSGRHVSILHQLHQPADHPVSIYHPEGEYLKGLVLHVE